MAAVEWRSRTPWYFRLAVVLERLQVRGATRMRQWFQRSGLLDRPVRVALSEQVGILVPLDRPTVWLEADVRGYESALVDVLVDFLRRHSPSVLVDCGADIGLIGLRVAARCPALGALVAIEPNERAFPFLYKSLSDCGLPMASTAVKSAVADFTGKGVLRSPANDPSDHARFIVPDASGDVSVLKIDDVLPPQFDGALAIKLDVEGGELAALRGAVGALRTASCFLAVVEAHPAQVKRTGVDPCACIQLLGGIRPVKAFVVEEPAVSIDPGQPFFSQLSGDRVRNICIVSE